MPLARPNLDDRTFQDIVDETKRLIPRFTPGVDQPQRVRPRRRAHRAVRLDERDGAVPGQPGAGPACTCTSSTWWASSRSRRRVARADLTFWLSVAGRPGGPRPGRHRRCRPPLDDADADRRSPPPSRPSSARRELVAAHTSDAAATRLTEDVWDDLTLPGQSVDLLPVVARWPTGRRPATSASRESLAGLRAPARPGRRRRRASASTRATRRWPGRRGTARRGSRDRRASPTAPAASTRPATIVLLVPAEHEPLTLGGTLRLLAAGAAAAAAARPADVPGVAADRDDRAAGRRRHRPRRARQRRSRPSCSVAPTGVTGQTFRVSVTPVAARRDGRDGRVVDRRGTAHVDRRCRTSPRPGPTTGTSCGTPPPARSSSAPRSGYPDGIGPPARRDPAGRRRDPRHRLPLRRRRARQRRRPDAHRAAHRRAVRRRR